MSTPDYNSELFFVAPIGEPESDERIRSDQVLRHIVSRAADRLGLVAVRADQVEHPGQITLQVIEHIQHARGVVADLTGLNANVFYELALRHALRLPVALIAEKNTQLAFDLIAQRTVFVDHKDLDSADACVDGIVAQLQKGFDGAVESPFSTAVDLAALRTGGAVERQLVELTEAVETLAALNRDALGQRATIDYTARSFYEAAQRHPRTPLRWERQGPRSYSLKGRPADVIEALDRAIAEIQAVYEAELQAATHAGGADVQEPPLEPVVDPGETTVPD